MLVLTSDQIDITLCGDWGVYFLSYIQAQPCLTLDDMIL
jgi:hypothetical protein